jgi:Coenzyme PQQ synthesis protein D (PqqD)
MDDRTLLASRVRVPEHVVRREFPEEAVVLNLETGTYHGLNGTAARMLDGLEASGSAAEAVDDLAAQLGQPREVIERDVVSLCRALAERKLIEYDGADDPD